MPRDPVCGKKVDSNTPFKERFDSETYYFCSEDCLDEFEFNLEEYLEQEEEQAQRIAEE